MYVIYLETRFRDAVEMAESGTDRCARRVHRGLAQLYLNKLSTLRGEVRTPDASLNAALKVDPRHV